MGEIHALDDASVRHEGRHAFQHLIGKLRFLGTGVQDPNTYGLQDELEAAEDHYEPGSPYMQMSPQEKRRFISNQYKDLR